jgi:hypothetical protein
MNGGVDDTKLDVSSHPPWVVNEGEEVVFKETLVHHVVEDQVNSFLSHFWETESEYPSVVNEH